ncbi:glycosyltransferase [Candidatus Microgenomates bacterium]|nr:MAG: glycosyltransferase [Candidatus Microgenomates bacterium]
MQLTAHMIVKNEEQWVWYAVSSVIPFVSRFLIYDTGSTDRTVAIIKSINSKKIHFLAKGKVTPKELVVLRNEQIKNTKTEWFLLVDGDEVWPKKTSQELVSVLRNCDKNISAIVSKTIVPVGDVFHYQSESAGKYSILGRKGHFNIRAYRKRTGFLWQGLYPKESYQGKDGIAIQEKDSQLLLLKNPYWHLTHLRRSSKTKDKIKYEIGSTKDIALPEVFFLSRPNIVPSPWITYSGTEKLRALIRTPLVTVKRIFT